MIRLDYVGVLFLNELYLNKFSAFFELFCTFIRTISAKTEVLNYVQVEKQLIQ